MVLSSGWDIIESLYNITSPTKTENKEMRSSLHAGWDIAESLVDDILQDINQWQVMTLGPQYS